MANTFYSYSFGCRVNHAEKEALDQELGRLGYQFTADKPDLYIINSCSITNKAEREAKQLIYQVKRANPDTKVVVTGCAATNWLKTKQEIPEIDLIVDNQNKEYLAELLQKRFTASKDDPSIRSANIKSLPEQISVLPFQKGDIISPLWKRGLAKGQGEFYAQSDRFLNSGRLMLKIQDGCQRFCTYCIVPYLRGLPQSVPAEKIAERINSYGKRVSEAVLAAINTEAYGYDTNTNFVELLQHVLDHTHVPRISFGSIHPWSVNDQFFKFYQSYPGTQRILNFFHVPLQSGSNKILQIMKRGYTREEFLEKLHTLSELKSHTFIGTDVIVGYLEETDADFADTYDFLERTPISKFHVFRFSKRQHTAAFYLSKRLKEPTPQEKQKRAQALIELGRRKYTKFLDTHLGHTFSTLILEKEVEEGREGLLSNEIPVIVLGKKLKTGSIQNVKVEKIVEGKLVGKIT